jgi:minor extracellular serine protease Vpr
VERRRLSAVAGFVVASALAFGVGVGSAGGPATDGGVAATIDTGSALVQLNGDPLSTYEKTKPPQGKKIDFSANQVKAYRAQLNKIRNDFKQWLKKNAPAANVTGQFDIALNAVGVELNGVSIGTLRSAPMVVSADYEGVYVPQDAIDPDLALVHAVQAWAAGGGGSDAKGAGVKVAIVDTGIDTSHPCFSDGGAAEANGETNGKVVFAGVFNNKQPSRKYSPEDLNGHGTHVAGTVACNENTDAGLVGIVPYAPSGVAPEALLGNFNVFPGDVGNARSEDILNALESAYEHGFDVANMSLGGDSSGIKDLLGMGVDNLDQAGMVIAVASGNSGPGFSTVESPGNAARALTAGAFTVGHFIGVNVTDNEESQSYPAAIGQFGPGPGVTADLAVDLGIGCSSVASSASGNVALIQRGTCSFSTKIRNAQTAGAVGVVIYNNVAGPPISMAQDGTANQPTIPAVMISMADGATLNSGHGGHSTTIGSEASAGYVYGPSGDNVMAGFSGQGPTDVDFRVKPDVVAPGVNVLSSQPAWTCDPPAGEACWAFFQGTSMATPHLAGIAAVVIGQHPTWSAAQVRSAIVNTADQGVVLGSNGSPATSVNLIGSGRANALSAVGASVALDPVSVSFGAVPSGSGRSDSRTVSLSTLSGGGPYTVEVTNQTGAGVTFAATISGDTITVTMEADKKIQAGNRQGILRVKKNGTEVAHAAIYALIK